MAFRVKDLMINVMPAADPKEAIACGGCTRCSDCSICSACSRCSGCTRCSGCSNCSGCSRCTPWSCDQLSCMWSYETIINYAQGGQSPEALSMLKEQLRQELARVEEQEAQSQGAEPQTVEEIDELEGRLRDALKELQARRRALLQQGGGKK